MTATDQHEELTETSLNHAAPASAGRARAVVESVLIAAGVAIFGIVLPHHIAADASVRYANLLALLDHGDLVPGAYSIVGPLFATPLVVLGRAIGHEYQTAELYNSVVFAVGLASLALLLRGRLPGPTLRQFLLVLIIGSMFSAHVVHWNSEVFTAVALAVGFTAFAARRWVAAGWSAVVLAVVNTPAAMVGLALALGRRIVEDRRLRYGLAVLAAVVLIGAQNWLRNGDPFDDGYADNHGFQTVMPYSGQPGFSYPFLFGLLSVCLSFGKGLLFFAPGLALPVRRTMSRLMISDDRSLYRLYLWWILLVAGLVIVYSRWWAWYGGLTWGPRFLLFASVPAALAIAVRLNDLTAALWLRLLTLVVLTLSTWVGLCGAVFIDASLTPVCSKDNFQFESLCHYTPDYSVLWYPFVHGLSVTGPSVFVLSYFALVFAWLAWPLCRSIGGDIVAGIRRRMPAFVQGWRW